MSKFSYNTEYEAGQDNIEILGMDIHNPVFLTSALLILSFAIGTLAFPNIASSIMGNARTWTLENFDWLFVIATNFIFIFCLAIALSPLGNIRLGGQQARPEFSTLSWVAMLFSAGMGIGLMFYGAAEPMAYYTGWSGTPLDVRPETAAAERLAFSATLFHWGITPWAVYAVIGLALGFFAFNKGLPLTIRSAFYPLLGERVWGWPGHFIDLFAVVSTLFGLATSLGLGAKQAVSGLNFLFGIEASITSQIILIAAITALAVISVVRGLEGGVKVLSNINIALAFFMLLFVILAGPTLLIITGIGENTLHYIADTFALSQWGDRNDTEWFHGWTVFYWAWWISWSPFVGMFIARVSKGRTIRQFLGTVMFVPVLVSIFWFTAFGTTALDQIQNDVGSLPDGIKSVSLVLFQMLENLPFAHISSAFAVVLVIVFFVTSSDSGSLVIDSITAGGKLHAPTPQRVFWATMEGLIAIVLLYGGGTQALTAMQAGTITTALPFTIVLLVCCASLYKGLADEQRSIRSLAQALRKGTRSDIMENPPYPIEVQK